MTNQNTQPNSFPGSKSGVIAIRLTTAECTGLVNKTISVPEGMQAIVLRSGRIEAILDQPGQHPVQDWTGTLIDLVKGRSEVQVILVSLAAVRLYWGSRMCRLAGAGSVVVQVEGEVRIRDVRALVSRLSFEQYLTVGDLENATADAVFATCQAILRQVSSKEAIHDPSLVQRLTFDLTNYFRFNELGIEVDERYLLVEVRDPVRDKLEAQEEQFNLERALSEFADQAQLVKERAQQEFRHEMGDIQQADKKLERMNRLRTAEEDTADTKRLESLKADLRRHGYELQKKDLIEARELDELAHEIDSSREERDIRSSFRLQQLKRKARDRAAEKEFEFKRAELERESELQLQQLNSQTNLESVRRHADIAAARQKLEADLASAAQRFQIELDQNRQNFDETIRQEIRFADKEQQIQRQQLELEKQKRETEFEFQTKKDSATTDRQLTTMRELAALDLERRQLRAEIAQERRRSEQEAEQKRLETIAGMKAGSLIAVSDLEKGRLIAGMAIADAASQQHDPEQTLAMLTAASADAANVLREKYAAQHQKDLAEAERRHYEARLQEQKSQSEQRIKDHQAQLEAERRKDAEARNAMVDFSKHALDTNRDIASASHGATAARKSEPTFESATQGYCPSCQKEYGRATFCPSCGVPILEKPNSLGNR